MADKTNNDDLNLDDKLADDLLNDIDDLDSIDGLDDMGDDIDLDSLDDIDEDDADDISKDIKASEDSIPEEDDLEVLDKEIASLNGELSSLEEDNHESNDFSLDKDDDGDEDEDDDDDDDDDDDYDDDDDDLEDMEAKQQRKNALIRNGAMGVFALMVGGFVYNLMFAGELPNETNVVAETSAPKQSTVSIDVNSKTPNLDDTFKSVEQEINAKQGNVTNETSSSNPSVSDKVLEITTVIEPSDKKAIKPKASQEEQPKAKESVEMDDHNVNNLTPVIPADLNEELHKKITKGMSRAQGVSISEDGVILDQEMQPHDVQVGTEISYYAYNIKVITVLLDGNLVLFSNGTFADSERVKVDRQIMEMAKAQKLMKQKEEEILKRQEQAEADKAMALAKEKAREEERLKAQEAQQAQKIQLEKALERLNTLSKEVERKNTPKKEVPKLLEGWSVNGEFKAVKNGYVLNGYLIRDADGNFYKMLVGDTHEEFGLIRGYDGNGRFFIGNSYIL